MIIDRRQLMKTSLGLAVLTGVPGVMTVKSFASTEPTAADRIKEFTGGSEMLEGKLSLTTPEIAENGNVVPVLVEVDSEMTDGDFVEEIMVVADGNPNPEVVKFRFTPMSGEATAKIRIRLAQTQNVTAIARMNDGSFQVAANQVKVTIGGCGG